MSRIDEGKQKRKLNDRKWLLRSPEETRSWGAALGSLLRSGDLLALEGDLGAGKTWLTSAIALGMGIRDEVSSPTFPLIQEYSGPLPMFHLDPYRLERPEEIYELGLEEYLQREGVVVIEWANLVDAWLPLDRLTLRLTFLEEEAYRQLHARAGGDRSGALLDAINQRIAAGKESAEKESAEHESS